MVSGENLWDYMHRFFDLHFPGEDHSKRVSWGFGFEFTVSFEGTPLAEQMIRGHGSLATRFDLLTASCGYWSEMVSDNLAVVFREDDPCKRHRLPFYNAEE